MGVEVGVDVGVGEGDEVGTAVGVGARAVVRLGREIPPGSGNPAAASNPQAARSNNPYQGGRGLRLKIPRDQRRNASAC